MPEVCGWMTRRTGDADMSDSRSAPLKAAWERARRYAAEHGVSVSKARSILAKQPSEPKPKPAKQLIKRTAKPAKTSGSPDLAAAEKVLRAKYPHVIAGTLRAHSSGAHAGRRTVEIRCQAAGCKN